MPWHPDVTFPDRDRNPPRSFALSIPWEAPEGWIVAVWFEPEDRTFRVYLSDLKHYLCKRVPDWMVIGRTSFGVPISLEQNLRYILECQKGRLLRGRDWTPDGTYMLLPQTFAQAIRWQNSWPPRKPPV